MSKRVRVFAVTVVLIAVALTLVFALQVTGAGESEIVATFEASMGQFPEGIAVDKKGNVYVGLGPPLGPVGEIRRIGTDGTMSTLLQIPGGPGPAGMAIDAPGNLYYAFFTLDEATRGVYRVTDGGDAERLPGSGAIMLANGLAFDKKGNLYVSDSIPGIVWRIPPGGAAEVWFQHDLLTGCGLDPNLPPVGANGLAYRNNALYVASTERGLIMRLPVLADGSADEAEAAIIAGQPDCDPEFDELDSVDGIALDARGDIFALLVIQNKMVKVDADTGEVTVLFDEEDGLHNPASLAFGTGKGQRKSVYLTNFALIPPGPPTSVGPAVIRFEVGVAGQPLP